MSIRPNILSLDKSNLKLLQWKLAASGSRTSGKPYVQDDTVSPYIGQDLVFCGRLFENENKALLSRMHQRRSHIKLSYRISCSWSPLHIKMQELRHISSFRWLNGLQHITKSAEIYLLICLFHAVPNLVFTVLSLAATSVLDGRQTSQGIKRRGMEK